MFKYISFLVIFGCCHLLVSQNLAPNNSFELHSSCPNNYSQLTFATSWTLVTNHTGTPDYFNTCGASPVNTTSSFWGSQAPATGNGYAGVLAWHSALPSGREYIQAQLTSPLAGGQTYAVSLKASLGDICNFATTLQIYFSSTPYVMSPAGSTNISTVTPQVAFTTVATNKAGWTTMTFNYTATGGEQYMIIGNFRNDATTVLTAVAGGSNNQTYYFLDDVSVMLAPLPVELISFSGDCSDELINLQWETSSEINNEYFLIEGSEDGVSYFEELRIEGAGNSNITHVYSAKITNPGNLLKYFRLSQVDFNGDIHTYDPISVNCENTWDHTCPQFVFADQQLYVNFESNEAEELNIILMDMKGSMLHSGNYSTNKGQNSIQIPCDGVSSGIYMIQLVGANRSCVQKFFIH